MDDARDFRPRSLIDPPPAEMIPKTLTDALIEIAKLQVTCVNQEKKLNELSAENEQQGEKIAGLEKIINTASGFKIAVFWASAALVGISTVWYNAVNGKWWK